MGKRSAKKSAVPHDEIGDRGEAIFEVRITDFCGRNFPYFRCHFLGEKTATFDYLVELEEAGETTPWFFFIQVKATKQGRTKRGQPRLKVKVEKEHVLRMAKYPAPTYVVGIDEPQEKAYIVAVFGTMNRAIASLPTAHELSCDNLKRLWDEVKGFWSCRDMVMQTSAFALEDH